MPISETFEKLPISKYYQGLGISYFGYHHHFISQIWYPIYEKWNLYFDKVKLIDICANSWIVWNMHQIFSNIRLLQLTIKVYWLHILATAIISYPKHDILALDNEGTPRKSRLQPFFLCLLLRLMNNIGLEVKMAS